MDASSSAGWMAVTEWLERGVLLTLIGLSVWSVSIMIDRYRYFRALKASFDPTRPRDLVAERDWKGLSLWAESQKHPVAGTLKAALCAVSDHDVQSEAIDRAVRSFLIDERSRLDRGLTVLATLGSNAPFIGLFGTVLGIIKAFGGLASASSGAQTVMASISFALIATAIGLFVAIPAVVAYNYFSRELRSLMSQCESIKELFVSRRLKGQ